jgi:hypothetical protein
MARQDFIIQLQNMGFDVEDMGGGKLAILYPIPVGKQIGQKIKLGFKVGDDFPGTPPSGPHVSPRILPINTTSGSHPNNGIHESPDFGPEWEYWSRPFPSWGMTDHSVRVYMAHIRHLFETL